MSATIIIQNTDPASPAAQALIAELDAYQAPMYPQESNHLDSLDELKKPNVKFVGAFEKDEMLACGAVKFFSDYGEIKRVYVPERHRGRGLAKRIMLSLEQQAIAQQLLWARLETGIYQPEAIGLYEALGYQHCPPFGDYSADPMSVFMQKALASK